MRWEVREARKRERREGGRGSSSCSISGSGSGSGSGEVEVEVALYSCFPRASHHARMRLGRVLSERTEAL